MSESKHTLGPWLLNETPSGGAILVRGGGSHRHMQSHLQIVPIEDAHLIAAAPCLLDALEEVLDGLGFLSGGDWELEGYGISTERGAEIRQILAKAKGEV